MNGNTKRKLKKEYIPLLIALLVLVVLVLTLIIVVFYNDKKGLIVPDVPDKVALDVGIFDYDSGKYNPDSLDVDDTKKTKVDYQVITDYYTNGIMISNPTVKYSDNEFIVKSGIYANDPFISVINKSGKLDWISKINSTGYENLKIIDVIKVDDNYHVFAVGTNENKYDNILIRLDSKGNEKKREVLSKESTNSIKSVLNTNKGFVVMMDGKNNIEIYYVSYDYKMLKNPFLLKDSDDNKFKTYIPYITASVVKDEVVTIVIRYTGASDNTMYLLNYDLNSGKVIINPFAELIKIASPYTNIIESYEDKFYTIYNNILYLFSNTGALIKKYDYSSVNIGKLSDCEGFEDIECIDEIWVEKFSINDNGNLTVQSETISDNLMIDIFDKDLKIKNRIVHDKEVHESNDVIYISSFYIDNKFYEFYLFGVDTPSILVSIIG